MDLVNTIQAINLVASIVFVIDLYSDGDIDLFHTVEIDLEDILDKVRKPK